MYRLKSTMAGRMIAILVLTAVLIPATHAAGNDSPKDTVLSFNSSITNNDPDTAIEQLAGGGVQFVLRSLHAGMAPESLTTDIVQHWSTIVPVVLASTSSYLRRAEILNTEVNGDVATVWAKTTTESTAKGSDKKKVSIFTEVYLLIHLPEGWKIAAIADNRQATKINEN